MPEKSRQDWFRNEDWNQEIEAQFRLKLGRAKKKAQYLCLQAYHLCQSHPRVALLLLDEYFRLDHRFNDARAYRFRAQAYRFLNNIHKAVEAFECALERESAFAGYETDSRVELPNLIATEGIHSLSERALQLLAKPGIMLFPVERFKYRAAYALILSHGVNSSPRESTPWPRSKRRKKLTLVCPIIPNWDLSTGGWTVFG
jgi:tetratricopeptide (TPR) repeat protein